MLSGVNNLLDVKADEITFAEDNEFQVQVCSSDAGLVVVREDFPAADGVTLLRVARPRVFSR